jgi:thiosulfate/3-mercaptopyruvate sulfurtransferase
MSQPLLPLIVEPEAFAPLLSDPGYLIVDLCKPDTYAQIHLPGAVHISYADLIRIAKPAMGLLPDDAQLTHALSAIGLRDDLHVVAYDDEGGGRAARLIWTLHVVGHQAASMLNGGLHAWYSEKLPLTNEPTTATPSEFIATARPDLIADRGYILANLDNTNLQLVDSRSEEEYAGTKRFASQGGHIPGAKHFDWQYAMDAQRQLRLRPEAEIKQMLDDRGISSGLETVVYCQTHHRSSYNYVLLKSLGFPNVKAYPGSWSEWGNDLNLPVAT